MHQRSPLGLAILVESRLDVITTDKKDTTETIGAISAQPDNDESPDVVHHPAGLERAGRSTTPPRQSAD